MVKGRSRQRDVAANLTSLSFSPSGFRWVRVSHLVYFRIICDVSTEINIFHVSRHVSRARSLAAAAELHASISLVIFATLHRKHEIILQIKTHGLE